MGVVDAQWLSVWWPWLLVWAAEVVVIAAAVTITVRHWRKARVVDAPPGHGVGFYLDDEFVMQLYRQFGGKYRATLTHEVEERISESGESGVHAEVPSVGGITHRGANNSEVFRRYVEDTAAITIIDMIINVLDAADDIVYIDLRKQDVLPNRALRKSLDLDESDVPSTVRFRELGPFVSLRGRFRRTDTAATVSTFQAPFGDTGASVHLTCADDGFKGAKVPPGEFPARCLGQVQNWDADNQQLIIHPIAIFR